MPARDTLSAMRIATTLLALLALVVPSAFEASTEATSLDSLYAGRRWTELYNVVQSRPRRCSLGIRR